MNTNLGRILVVISIAAMLGLAGYALHGKASEVEPANLLYVYQSLITGVLAAFAAGLTVYEMRSQAAASKARHEKDMATAEKRHQETLAMRQQEQKDIRASQLAVYKLATRKYIEDVVTALDQCVDEPSSIPSEHLIHIDQWKIIGTPPPDIVIDYYYISKVPAQDIAKCLSIMLKTSKLYRSIRSYHEKQQIYNHTLCVNLEELDEKRRDWHSDANNIRLELAALSIES